MVIEAEWDDRLRRFKYKIPGVGWAVAEKGHSSLVSSNAVLIREAKLVANIVGVRLPDKWELLVRR